MSTAVPKEPEAYTVSSSKDRCSGLEIADHSAALTDSSETGDLKHLENLASAAIPNVGADLAAQQAVRDISNDIDSDEARPTTAERS